MLNHPFIFFSMTAIVICLIGLSKGGFGGIAGSLATPLMALVMPANEVIGLLLPVLIIADIFAVTSHWQRWDRKLVLLLLPGALVGVVLGTFFITHVAPLVLRQALGVIAILFSVYRLFEQAILGLVKYRAYRWHGVAAGAVAGFSSTLAHTGGPPITIYLLMQEVTPQVFIATSALFFFALNWLKVPFYFYAGQFDFNLIGRIVWLLPLLPLSVWAGKWGATKINKIIFDRVILFFLALSGVLLLV
jgi:uncharacterized protein